MNATISESGFSDSFGSLVDDLIPRTYAIAREVGIRMDSGFRGELARMFERPGIRRAICRRSGVSVDEFGELVWSRGLTAERLDCNAVLQLLELAIGTPAAGRKRSDASRDAAAADREVHALEVRRKSRLRLFECSRCGKKLRGATDDEDSFHRHVDPDTGAEFFAPYLLKSPILRSSHVPF